MFLQIQKNLVKVKLRREPYQVVKIAIALFDFDYV